MRPGVRGRSGGTAEAPKPWTESVNVDIGLVARKLAWWNWNDGRRVLGMHAAADSNPRANQTVRRARFFFICFGGAESRSLALLSCHPCFMFCQGWGFVYSNSPNGTAETMGVKERLCTKKKGRRRRRSRLIIIKPLFPFPMPASA